MKKKQLRVEKFLDEMSAIVPWKKLVKLIKPYYRSENGRPPHDLELMLRIHFLQLWHNLSDPGMEEAIYDRLSFQKFLGFDCFGGVVPDESSICRFRHLIETRGLSKKILNRVNKYLSSKGLVLKGGTIVDATLFQAPVSRENKDRKRDPEMSSTRKNNKWYFGAKGHIGVQSEGKSIIHSTDFTTAKSGDIKSIDSLYHGKERAVFGDSAYSKRDDKIKARANGVYYGISDRGYSKHPLSKSQKAKNKKNQTLRNKVEHPFRIIKHVWGHYKLRYKGLFKNASRFTTLCALQNLYICRKDLINTA